MQYGSNNYSLLGDLRDRQLTTSYQDQNPQMDTMADLNKSATPNWQNAAAQGAVQGGASGSVGSMLMGGGLGAALAPGAFAAGASAGPVGLGVAGAGLLLTQLEQKQKAKAMQEQAIAEEANNRKAQTMAALNNLMNQRVSVA